MHRKALDVFGGQFHRAVFDPDITEGLHADVFNRLLPFLEGPVLAVFVAGVHLPLDGARFTVALFAVVKRHLLRDWAVHVEMESSDNFFAEVDPVDAVALALDNR